MSKLRDIFRLYDAFDLRMDQEVLPQDELGSHELVGQTLKSAISPGTELAAYTGMEPLRPTTTLYPRLMGYCNVARVIDCGRAVERVVPGDIILTHQPHCSAFRITEGDILCLLKADDDLNEMSTTYLFHLGYSAALKGKITAGHKVAVVGLGTLGLTASAVAHLCGADEVVGFTNHAPSEQSMSDFHLTKALPKDNDECDSSFDVVVVTSSRWEDWKLSLRLARQEAVIVLIGFPGRGAGLPDFNPLASEYVYDKQLTMVACGKTPGGSAFQGAARFDLKQNCEFLSNAIRSGRLPGQSLIHSVIEPGDLKEGYEHLLRKRADAKTLVLDWE